MRLITPLAIGAVLVLSTPAFAEAPVAKPDSKQTPAPAANETVINLKVTGMT